MPQTNQHKPLPPEEDLRPVIAYYWRLGMQDPAIVQHSKDHIDLSKYGLSVKSTKRLRKKWGLLSAFQQKHTFDTIAPFIGEIRSRFPTMGARQMVSVLRQDYSMRVAEKMVAGFLLFVERDAVKARRARRFKRKRFWAAGVMDILAFDQHDKWKRFGLWLHLGLDPFSGRLAWLKIWWTNRNPRLVTSYYLEASRKIGGIPLITQSDLGSENNGIANCHTHTRHRLDPSLCDTLQHRWKRNKNNVKPEAGWSQLRRQFTPGFEDILDKGVNDGLYDPADRLESLVFRWLAIPWLQAELDAWMRRYNSTPRRRDKNKILPQGIPDLIHAKPQFYGSRDFKVIVPPALFDEMELEWVNPTDPVFLLVPKAFEAHAISIYASIGRPTVTSTTFWGVYIEFLAAFNGLQGDPSFVETLQVPEDEGCDVEILPGLRELRNGDNVLGDHGYYYMGGLEHPPPVDGNDGDSDSDDMSVGNLDLRDFADFTPEEESN